ncbi:ROK family glucokinase [Anaerostipes sp.]|uniref:ROK family glucokinase n=1 Tax=Anaerostipes sp. TaxID=1872530 RepID=UPI0025C54580|nr:ROK family glucokinase [Anaerostipes sp.]MBS7007029.1 ROK family glucokinase [Anaerostipes sp.]
MKYIYGIDVGGTTVKLGLFKEDGSLVEKWEIPTRKENGGAHIIEDIGAALKENIAAHEIREDQLIGAGVGVPGAVLSFEKVNECVNLGWGQVNVAEELGKLLGCPVKVTNDANVAALGELWVGAAKDFCSAVMVTLGTGVGGGMIVDGQIINGSHGYGGEIGHMTVNPAETRRCNCGKTGCLELYASATGIVFETKKALKESDAETSLRRMTDFSAKDIFDLAKEGDAFAAEQVDHLGEKLALAFGNITLTVDPEVFVLGGGVSKAGNILLDAIKKHYRKYTFGAVTEGKFILASLGNDAGIYGAARLIKGE